MLVIKICGNHFIHCLLLPCCSSGNNVAPSLALSLSTRFFRPPEKTDETTDRCCSPLTPAPLPILHAGVTFIGSGMGHVCGNVMLLTLHQMNNCTPDVQARNMSSPTLGAWEGPTGAGARHFTVDVRPSKETRNIGHGPADNWNPMHCISVSWIVFHPATRARWSMFSTAQRTLLGPLQRNCPRVRLPAWCSPP